MPIDGVGHQLHNNINVDVSQVEAAFAAVEARHLVNHVTELDVSLYTTDAGSCYGTPPTGCQAELTGAALTAALQTQALKYRALFTAFAAHTSVTSVTMWGTTDAHSWLNTFPTTRTNYPLLFDRSNNPKSAFWAVVDPAFVP